MPGNSNETGKRGVLIVVVNRGLYHVLDSPDPVATMVTGRFARVGPDDCLLSGNPERCRVNALLSTSRDTAGLYVYPAEKEAERREITAALSALISPQ